MSGNVDMEEISLEEGISSMQEYVHSSRKPVSSSKDIDNSASEFRCFQSCESLIVEGESPPEDYDKNRRHSDPKIYVSEEEMHVPVHRYTKLATVKRDWHKIHSGRIKNAKEKNLHVDSIITHNDSLVPSKINIKAFSHAKALGKSVKSSEHLKEKIDEKKISVGTNSTTPTESNNTDVNKHGAKTKSPRFNVTKVSEQVSKVSDNILKKHNIDGNKKKRPGQAPRSLILQQEEEIDDQYENVEFKGNFLDEDTFHTWTLDRKSKYAAVIRSVHMTKESQPPPPRDYILLSCIVLVCCNLPLGALALCFSLLIERKYGVGDYTAAQRASKLSLLVAITGMVLSVTLVLTLLIVYWPDEDQIRTQ